MTKEGVVQAYARVQLRARGCLVRKIGYEGRRGCPDHIVFIPSRPVMLPGVQRIITAPPATILIEYKKTEDTEPADHQIREHERIRAVGGVVHVVGSTSAVDKLIRQYFPFG
jgi:hypothetical protein